MSDDPDPLSWETTGTAIDYRCPGFDVRRDDVRLPDGTETDYHYVDEPPAVVILPFDADGDVVVIEEWRQAVGRVNRGLPAGTTEPEDGDLRAAAHRELREETGYEAAEMEPLTTVEPANGIANTVHHYFVARGCEPTGEQELDFNESIRVGTTDYERLLAAVVSGENADDEGDRAEGGDGDANGVVDGRTAVGVMRYELTER
ncbi:ADP-ribose pyrophosphatase [Halogranum amylolyticum]|uniref:ADP-ribose pyrophosphatase n=1 Tax=Halogranum amylolyticum TaxID=660520 RepID=A0A1H8N4G0_9EURY|nr:NUDIX hydrolase [Halogranum amylolyticum]SEO24452.1 ADP-ribose pyrophosphatase [Halogranum amylolyticum]